MKITPADLGAAKAFEWHLPACGLYQHTPTDWSNPYCTCDPTGRLAAAFAAHRLEHGDDGLEYRIIKLERELGALRSEIRRPYTTAELSNMKTGGMG